jgi:hypothetical protein
VDVGHLDVCYTRRRERSKSQRVAVKVGGFWSQVGVCLYAGSSWDAV